MCALCAVRDSGGPNTSGLRHCGLGQGVHLAVLALFGQQCLVAAPDLARHGFENVLLEGGCFHRIDRFVEFEGDLAASVGFSSAEPEARLALCHLDELARQAVGELERFSANGDLAGEDLKALTVGQCLQRKLNVPRGVYFVDL